MLLCSLCGTGDHALAMIFFFVKRRRAWEETDRLVGIIDVRLCSRFVGGILDGNDGSDGKLSTAYSRTN